MNVTRGVSRGRATGHLRQLAEYGLVEEADRRDPADTRDPAAVAVAVAVGPAAGSPFPFRLLRRCAATKPDPGKRAQCSKGHMSR